VGEYHQNGFSQLIQERSKSDLSDLEDNLPNKRSVTEIGGHYKYTARGTSKQI